MGSLKSIAKAAPPAWTLYPFLTVFVVACVVNGAWQAGLERAVLESQRISGAVNAVVAVPPCAGSLRILSEIKI